MVADGEQAEPNPAPQGAVRRPRVSRRTALGLAGGFAGVLALGWLVDSAVLLPLAPTASSQTEKQAGRYLVRWEHVPAQPTAGQPVNLTATISDDGGQPTIDLRVSVRLTMEAMAHPPVTHVARSLGAGRYAVSTTFPMPGPWLAEVLIDQAGRSPLAAAFDVRVR